MALPASASGLCPFSLAFLKSHEVPLLQPLPCVQAGQRKPACVSQEEGGRPPLHAQASPHSLDLCWWDADEYPEALTFRYTA